MARFKRYIEKENFPKIEGLIFYNLYGKTYIRSAQKKNKIPLSWSVAAWEKFMAAHSFAKAIVANPVDKAAYELKTKGKCSAYETALWEYLFKDQ